MKKLLVLLLILFLAGCTNNAEVNNKTEDIKPFELNDYSTEKLVINNQEFEIIPYFNEYTDYVNTEYKNREETIESYRKTVLTPLARLLVYSTNELENDFHFTRPENMEKQKKVLMEINNQYPNIRTQIQEALENATSRLEGEEKIKIYILPFPDDQYSSQYMRGVGGLAMGASRNILMFVDPFNYTNESLKAITVHEYHHTALLMNKSFKVINWALLDSVLIEGKAELFTKIIYPSYEPLYLDRLSPEFEPNIWNYIKEKSKTSYNPNDLTPLFYGDFSLRFPTHSNYKMGYKILEELLKKYPEMDVSTWTYMDAIEIVEDLNVDSWYE